MKPYEVKRFVAQLVICGGIGFITGRLNPGGPLIFAIIPTAMLVYMLLCFVFPADD